MGLSGFNPVKETGSWDRVMQLKSVSVDELIRDLFDEPVTVEDMGHHEDLRNYVIKVNRDFILKIYGDKLRWQREVENLIRLRSCGFRTPSLIDYGMVNPLNGWILTNVLPGQIMTDFYAELSRMERKKLWSHLGELLAQLHMNNTIDYKDITIYNRKDIKSAKSYWEFLIDEYENNKNKIVNNQCYGQAAVYQYAFSAIENGFSEIERDEKSPYVICNSDFSLRNILYDKEQNCYSLIDFEMGMYGLPESDFARVLLDLIPEKLSDSFLDGYYGKSCHIKKDIRIIRLFLLMKIVEICSWSYKRSPDYYVKTFHTLENMYDQSDE